MIRPGSRASFSLSQRRGCMKQEAVDISVVVPVYDCGGCLERNLAELRQFQASEPRSVELLLVDDRGTRPDVSAVLREFVKRTPNAVLIQNDRNRGKGYSVTRGMLGARGRFRVFTDVDLAYPLSEITKVVSALEDGADVAIACRVHPDSEYEMSSTYLRYIYTRHFISRVFNRLVRTALIPGVYDTQAGLKGFTSRAAHEIFSRVRIDGFGFDLESLFIASRLGFRIDQIPVRYRYHDEPTTVRFVRDGREMLTDLARIRWRGWTGEYTAQPEPETARAAVVESA